MFCGIHHLAFIAADLDATIRFWRDLLGLEMFLSAGDDDFKHYFFRLGDHDAVAFFWWPGAAPMEVKRPGVRTALPRGFDHVAIGVRTKGDLLALRDRLIAADVEVTGPVDHGITLSLYLTDPNGLSVELAWQRVELLQPALLDATPVPAAREGSAPQGPARPTRWAEAGAAPAVAVAVAADAQLARVAAARGLLRFLDEGPSDEGAS